MLRKGLWSRQSGALESPGNLDKETNEEQEREGHEGEGGVTVSSWGEKVTEEGVVSHVEQ